MSKTPTERHGWEIDPKTGKISSKSEGKGTTIRTLGQSSAYAIVAIAICTNLDPLVATLSILTLFVMALLFWQRIPERVLEFWMKTRDQGGTHLHPAFTTIPASPF